MITCSEGINIKVLATIFEGQRNGGLAVGTKQQHKSEKSIKNS